LTASVAIEGRHGKTLLTPVGIPTPHQMPAGFSVEGGSLTLTGEATTGQMASVITVDAGAPAIDNSSAPKCPAPRQDQTDRLPLAEPNLNLTQNSDNLLRRISLPCHFSFPINGLEIAGLS
jgi:hypothetical protein